MSVRKLPGKWLRVIGGRHRDYAEVFSSPEGKRVLADICATAKIGKDVFVAGDPYATAYQAGMQVIANRIINQSGQGIVDVAAQMRALGEE